MAENNSQPDPADLVTNTGPLPAAQAGVKAEPVDVSAHESVASDIHGQLLQAHEPGGARDADVLDPHHDQKHVLGPLLGGVEEWSIAGQESEKYDSIFLSRLNEQLKLKINKALDRPDGVHGIIFDLVDRQRRQLRRLLDGNIAAKRGAAAGLGDLRLEDGATWAGILDDAIRMTVEEMHPESINNPHRLQEDWNSFCAGYNTPLPPPDGAPPVRELMQQILGTEYGDFQFLPNNTHATILLRALLAEQGTMGNIAFHKRLRDIWKTLPVKQLTNENADTNQTIGHLKQALEAIPDEVAEFSSQLPQMVTLSRDLFLAKQALAGSLDNTNLAARTKSLEDRYAGFADTLSKLRTKLLSDADNISSYFQELTGTPVALELQTIVTTIQTNLSHATPLVPVWVPPVPPSTDPTMTTPGIDVTTLAPLNRTLYLAANKQVEESVTSSSAGREPMSHFALLHEWHMRGYKQHVPNLQERRHVVLAEIFLQEQMVKNTPMRKASSKDRERETKPVGTGFFGLINRVTRYYGEKNKIEYWGLEQSFSHLQVDFGEPFRSWLSQLNPAKLTCSG
jgi:hypothetical protein